MSKREIAEKLVEQIACHPRLVRGSKATA
jgi:hypothetical protein